MSADLERWRARKEAMLRRWDRLSAQHGLDHPAVKAAGAAFGRAADQVNALRSLTVGRSTIVRHGAAAATKTAVAKSKASVAKVKANTPRYPASTVAAIQRQQDKDFRAKQLALAAKYPKAHAADVAAGRRRDLKPLKPRGPKGPQAKSKSNWAKWNAKHGKSKR